MTMTVEERKESRDQFPVGMRVLAVDDDPVCLKLLESLLRRCQYNVTTTDKAIMALKLLRENKDKFDLVISDVIMPDMDGFKLLELVGLEMDLPVIMLSANGETQAVMKGITHGACDYLLKPVRIEELRNIWQHVIRRRKFEKRCHNDLDSREDGQKAQSMNAEGVLEEAVHNGKINKKRKDQREDDEDYSEDNMQENDDPSNQKKPRVVWTVELHRKFVAAVNQLGIDKAVPKKILDLMNVEKLTRENVASHLQKYRLYLKRLSVVAGQQASMAAVVGGRNSPYLHTASLNGLGNYYAIGGSRQLPTLGSLQPNGVLGRMNSPSALGMQGLLPSQAVQLDSVQRKASNLYNDLGIIQGIGLPGNHQMNLLQGVPTTLESGQFQQPKLVQESRNNTGLCGSGLAAGPCSNSFSNVRNNPLSLQPNKQHNQSGEMGNYSSFRMSSSCSEVCETDLQGVSRNPHISRCNGSWKVGIASSRNPTDALPLLAPFSQNDLSSGKTRGNILSITPHSANKICDDIVAGAALCDPTSNDVQNQVCSPTTAGVDKDQNFPNFNIIGNSSQKWDYIFDSDEISSTSSHTSLPNLRITVATTQCQTSENAYFNKKLHADAIGQVKFGASLVTQNCTIDKLTSDSQLNSKGEYAIEATALQSGPSSIGCSFDDIANALIKPEYNEVAFLDMDIYDMYPLDIHGGGSSSVGLC